MTLETLPRPYRTQNPDDTDERSYNYTWLAADLVPSNKTWEVDPNAVSLDIFHSRYSKAYEVIVKAVWLIEGGYTEERITLSGRGEELYARLQRIPAERYSRKRLDELAARTLAEFPHQIPAQTAPARLWGKVLEYGIPNGNLAE